MNERERLAKPQKRVRRGIVRPIHILESRRGQELYIRLYVALVGVPGQPDWKMARKAINAGADVESLLNKESRTPLMVAAIYGNAEMCAFLLNKRARIDAVDDDGCSALELAAAMGGLDACRVLVRKGADVNEKNIEYGSIPLMRAAAGGWTDVCRFLVSKGALVNSSNVLGYTALMSAAKQGKAETCRALIGMGAETYPWDRDGVTAFIYAAKEGNPETCKAFLDNGSSVDEREYYSKQTPLMAAAAEGNVKNCKFLLENGADFNATDRDGWTALMHAAKWRQIKTCILLLGNGADPSTENCHSPPETAAGIARESGHNEVSAFLRMMETLGKDSVRLFLSDFRACIGQGI